MGNRKYHNLGNRKQMVDILCNKNYTMYNRGMSLTAIMNWWMLSVC